MMKTHYDRLCVIMSRLDFATACATLDSIAARSGWTSRLVVGTEGFKVGKTNGNSVSVRVNRANCVYECWVRIGEDEEHSATFRFNEEAGLETWLKKYIERI